MSLPYYKEYGWEPIVITVDEKYVEGYRDDLLNETVPNDIEVHKVKAWPINITKKIGLGSISIRSYYYFKRKGNELLKKRKFDLIFFSTTMFHVCALGRYWKKKFNIPFIVDFQDPWRNDFYFKNPQAIRPSKFRVSYAIHKKIEAYAMPFSDGMMAVSQSYIDTLKQRYPSLKNRPSIVLPFGTSVKDFNVVSQKKVLPQIINLNSDKIKVVYIGAMTQFFLELIRAFFIAFKQTIVNKEKYHFYFIGTNYKARKDKPVELLAAGLNMQHIVTEIPQRIPYFSAIATMMHSDILFIPGSLDADYNASKVYNNIQTGKPIFSIFNEKSLVKQIIEETNAGIVVGINNNDDEASLIKKISKKLQDFAQLHLRAQKTDLKKMESFGAKAMTLKQTEFFNKVLEYKNTK
jgi:hypothetical protein